MGACVHIVESPCRECRSFTIGLMTLHLGMANEGSDTGGRTWDCVCDVLVKIRCPHDPEVSICARLCVYAFRIAQIVVYDMGGCHMSDECCNQSW